MLFCFRSLYIGFTTNSKSIVQDDFDLSHRSVSTTQAKQPVITVFVRQKHLTHQDKIFSVLQETT